MREAGGPGTRRIIAIDQTSCGVPGVQEGASIRTDRAASLTLYRRGPSVYPTGDGHIRPSVFEALLISVGSRLEISKNSEGPRPRGGARSAGPVESTKTTRRLRRGLSVGCRVRYFVPTRLDEGTKHGSNQAAPNGVPNPVLQGREAHTTNLASKTAARYTNSALATNSNAKPTHFSTGHSTPSVALAASSSRVAGSPNRLVQSCVSLRSGGWKGPGRAKAGPKRTHE
jgi:hypothetical protein